MKELYSAEMLASLSGKLKKRWILVGVISALLLAAFVWSVVIRVEWLSIVLLALLGVFLIFFIEMFLLFLLCGLRISFFSVCTLEKQIIRPPFNRIIYPFKSDNQISICCRTDSFWLSDIVFEKKNCEK